MVNLGSVWDRTTDFLRDKSASVLSIAAGGIFVPLALFGILMPMTGAEATPADWGIAAILLVLGAVAILGNLALTALVIDPAADMRGALRAALARLPAALLVAVAGFVAAALAIAPIYAAFVMGGGTEDTAPAFGAALFVLVYALLLVVAGLVLTARLLLVYPALVAEGIGLAAIPRSLRLTARMTLKLVGVVILYVVVSQVADLAARTVFGVLLGLTAPPATATVLTAIILALVQTGFSAFATVFIARLFLAVRDMRETIVELS